MVPAWGAAVSTFVGGCTDLKVDHLSAAATSEDASGVIPYVLPKKSLIISITYVLKGCGTAVEPVTGQPGLSLDADATVTLVAANEADENERYAIPYVALRSWLKETSFTVESFGNKTLKTFNGTINDQTASVVSAVIGTAIKTAALVAAAGGPDEYCKPSVRADLASIALNKNNIADLRARPDAQKQDAKIAAFQAIIDKTVRENLTTKVSLTWSPSFGELKAWYPGRDAAVRVFKADVGVGQWLTPKGVQWLAANDGGKHDLNVVVSTPTWAHPKNAPSKTTGQVEGFVVRDPAFGTIFVCKGICPIPQDGLTRVDNVVATADAAFPQLGRKLVLPLHNSIAQNSVLDLSMSEDGVITKLGAHSTSTTAAGITALGANIDAEKAQIDARNKVKAEALTAAQNKAHDDNKRLAECLDAQKKIREDGGTPIGSCQ